MPSLQIIPTVRVPVFSTYWSSFSFDLSILESLRYPDYFICCFGLFIRFLVEINFKFLDCLTAKPCVKFAFADAHCEFKGFWLVL
jgi:hypothetical protein